MLLSKTIEIEKEELNWDTHEELCDVWLGVLSTYQYRCCIVPLCLCEKQE